MICPYCATCCGFEREGDLCITALINLHPILPTCFTDREGGNWIPYIGPRLSEKILLTFDHGMHSVHLNCGREWDEINSWRQPRKASMA